MKFKKTFLIGAIILSALTLSGCQSVKTSTTGENIQNVSNSEQGVISYDGSEFSPKEIKVPVGDQIVITNNSGETVQVNSDNHPDHDLYPELNIGVVLPGSSKSISFDKIGTYTYHNHLNASQGGTIIVE